MFYVYVLKSQSFDKFYIGQTKDLDKRMQWHNSPRARWTRRYQPWDLIYSDKFDTRPEAMKREKELKALKNIRQFLNL